MAMTIMAETRTTKVSRFTGQQVALLIVLAVLASSASGKMSEPVENFEAKASVMAHVDAGKAAESWTDCAHGKLQMGMWWQHQSPRMAKTDMQDVAEETTMKIKDEILAYASGTSKYASEKTTEATDAAMAEFTDAAMTNIAFRAKEDTFNDQARDAMQHIKSSAGEAQETLHSVADDAHAGAKKTAKRASDVANMACDDDKKQAKESMTTGAKRGYEAAKEKGVESCGGFECCTDARRTLVITLTLLSLLIKFPSFPFGKVCKELVAACLFC